MNKEEFFEYVDEGISVVDFFAEWCSPCKGQAVVINGLEKDNSMSNIKFLKLDVDKSDHNIADGFEIKSIPTVIIFNNGQEEYRFVGITNANILTKVIKKIKNNPTE